MRREERLRKFAVRCIQAAFNGELDPEVQEIALGLGLIQQDVATLQDCAAGFDGDEGDCMYRMAPWLKPQPGATA